MRSPSAVARGATILPPSAYLSGECRVGPLGVQMKTRKPKRSEARAAADARRSLPPVGLLLERGPVARLARRWGRPLVADLLRGALEELREGLESGVLGAAEAARRAGPAELAQAIEARARGLLAPRPRSVINATGVIVHTNLGRAVLSPEAARRVAEAAQAYMDLEYDLERGRRGQRMAHLAPLAARLFPGRGVHVVNNNAAAVLLVLRALARRREVVVSRGELVEIGGAFRIPEILSASGARLREVGTTNRTRLADYEAAIGPRTALLLKVHTSNFRIVGFTEETGVDALAGLARRAGVPLVVDWGSGDLVDLAGLGIRDELPVDEILARGADLVTFSGDKLLGGPQAGFIVGRPELVARVARDPLARACRVDRLAIAALHATLAAYVRGCAFREIPTLRMLALTPRQIARRARAVMERVASAAEGRAKLRLVDGVSRTGGGSSPLGERPTKLLAVIPERGHVARLERALRRGEPPVIGRVHEGALLFDLRTVLPEQDAVLAARIEQALDEP